MILIENLKFIFPVEYTHYEIGKHCVYVIGFFNKLTNDFSPAKDMDIITSLYTEDHLKHMHIIKHLGKYVAINDFVVYNNFKVIRPLVY